MVCCPSDLLQLSESWWNHYMWEVCSTNQWDAQKIAMPAASTGQKNGLNSSPWQQPTARHTIHASKVKRILLQSFASSATFTWPLVTNYHFFKHLNNFLEGKYFNNQQDGEKSSNSFQKLVRCMDFYAAGINNLFLTGKNVLIIMFLSRLIKMRLSLVIMI